MSELEGGVDEAPDYGRSVPLRFDYHVGEKYWPLVEWFGSQVIEFHPDVFNPGANTKRQIRSAVDCLLANLLEAHRISPNCFLAVSMRTQTFTHTRYRDISFGHKNFRRVIEYFTKAALVTFKRGFFDKRNLIPTGRTSRLSASPRLLMIVEGYNGAIAASDDSTTPEDVVEAAISFAEAVNASEARRISLSYSDIAVSPCSDVIVKKNAEGKRIEYDETEDTNAMRERLVKWNDFLAAHHHIDLLLPDAEIESIFRQGHDEGHSEIFFGDDDADAEYIEFKRVQLYRIFNNNSFDEGGRFYGGWWQGAPSRFRKFITINEHLTREFDYSNLHAAMLYAMEGLPLAEDAYSLPDVSEDYRKLIKRTFFKLINAREDQKIRQPQAGALPPGMDWKQLQDAIIAKHPAIKRYFRSGIGLWLQRTDSDIAERVMMRMMERDILVLPVHDSFISYGNVGDLLKSEMKDAYQTVVGETVEIDADDFFLEEFNADTGLDFEDFDVVSNVQADPGYEGFRKRHEEFLNKRDWDWRSRFG